MMALPLLKWQWLLCEIYIRDRTFKTQTIYKDKVAFSKVVKELEQKRFIRVKKNHSGFIYSCVPLFGEAMPDDMLACAEKKDRWFI